MRKILYTILGGLIAGLAIALLAQFLPDLESPASFVWMFLIGTGVFAVIEIVSQLLNKKQAEQSETEKEEEKPLEAWRGQ